MATTPSVATGVGRAAAPARTSANCSPSGRHDEQSRRPDRQHLRLDNQFNVSTARGWRHALQCQLGLALRRRLLLQREIGARQCAGPQFHELRMASSRESRLRAAVRRLQMHRQAIAVHLCDMRSRRHVLEMVASAGIGYRIATIFEIDANVSYTAQRRIRNDTGAFEHASRNEATIAEQCLAQRDRGARFVGAHAPRRCCSGHIHQRRAACTNRDLRNVANLQTLARHQRRDIEQQPATGISHERIRHCRTVATHGTASETQTRRQQVRDANLTQASDRTGIVDRQQILDGVADRCHRHARGLAQHHRVSRGVDRQIKRGGNGRHDIEAVAVRTIAESEWRARQALQIGDRGKRCKLVARWRLDQQAISTRCNQREAVDTSAISIAGATAVGDRCTGDHFRRIAANAVITEHNGRCASSIVDQPDARAVHGTSCAGIEHHAGGIDQARRSGSVV